MNIQLGQMHDHSFRIDPKHLGFVLRRYHFVARMLRGARSVLEIGCGDGTGAQIVRKAVGSYNGIDIASYQCVPGHDYAMHNILDGPYSVGHQFDAIYALDVLEHIEPTDEYTFFRNVIASLTPHGTVIIGAPSHESQVYASELSRRYHVNCKTAKQMFETLDRHFHNVFLLGLNDYALHDGFDQMCHYRLAICTGQR